jgi:hypothetical protein
MAYLIKEELSSVIREYQLDAITDNNDSIVDEAIAMAIEEASDILTPDNKKKWQDGRLAYDVTQIFNKVGNERNLLMLGRVKTLSLWHLVGLCNTGLDYKDVQDRYDRAKKDLKDLADGTTNSKALPVVTAPDTKLPYQSGSRQKFNHE